MAPVIKIYRSGALVCEVEGRPGQTLHQCLNDAGVVLDAPCGGQGKCGKCLVRLEKHGKQVLACKTQVNGDMEIYLPDVANMKIADGGAAKNARGQASSTQTPPDGIPICSSSASTQTPQSNSSVCSPSGSAQMSYSNTQPTSTYPQTPGAATNRLGVAMDIGTTTVVAHLTDLETGKRLATASGVNAQRPYGADVISRIKYCIENGHERLTQLIRDQIASLIRQTCTATGASVKDITYISIAANTIMEHLAAGYSPAGMGIVPFTPESLFGEEIPVWFGLPVAETARVYFAPAIAAYVGGDITAGMYAAGLEETQGPVIYLDIGTNGEISLKHGDKYFCCATAAGPAFEGAEISMGMAAVNGAINHAKWDGGLKLTVIGDGEPTGICGSGLLDALAILLDTGAVDEGGRLLGTDEIGHDISDNIVEIDGKNAFRLTDEGSGVYMTAMDIRKLQLAKSAIAAGIQTLLHNAGVCEKEIKALVLAGGFGSYMDHVSAARIGLFPMSILPVAKAFGNTAGEGAALALCSASARAALLDIKERCEYIELSTSKVFNEQFTEQMMFPEGVAD